MASQKRNVVATVLFAVFGGPGITLVWIPLWITRFHLPAGVTAWQLVTGMALIAVGLVPLFESMVRFVVVGRGTLVPTEETERLVVSGLYRYVRNPMYVGVMTAIAGEALVFWSDGLAIELIVAAVGFELFVRLYEEPRLTRKYGGEYLRYKANVRRWLPRISAWPG